MWHLTLYHLLGLLAMHCTTQKRETLRTLLHGTLHSQLTHLFNWVIWPSARSFWPSVCIHKESVNTLHRYYWVMNCPSPSPSQIAWVQWSSQNAFLTAQCVGSSCHPGICSFLHPWQVGDIASNPNYMNTRKVLSSFRLGNSTSLVRNLQKASRQINAVSYIMP